MDRVVGTCSLCGGAVMLSGNWMATVPQVPTCRSCGAIKKQPHGPVIDMVPRRPAETYAQQPTTGASRRLTQEEARQLVAQQEIWRGDGWRPL